MKRGLDKSLHRPRRGETRRLSALLPQERPDTLAVSALHRAQVTDLLLDESRQRFQSLFDHNPDAVMAFDKDGNFVNANKACERLSGYIVDELLEMSFHPLLYMEDADRVLREFGLASRGRARQFDLRIHHKKGHLVFLHVTCVPIHVGGSTVGVYVIAKNMTEQTRSRRILAGQKRVLEMIAKGHSQIEILHVLTDMVKSVYPNSLCAILKYAEDGNSLRHLAGQLPHHDVIPHLPAVTALNWDIPAQHFRALNGDSLAGVYKPIVYANGNVVGLCVLCISRVNMFDGGETELVDTLAHLAGLVLERKESERQIRRLAFYDPLTGLPNRRLILERAESAREYADTTNTRFAVMFMDLDRFKSINDSLGHGAGDDVLRTIAHRLQEAMRLEDTVSRIGGDEFIILLPDVRDEQAALDASQRILSVIEEPITLQGHAFRMTTSIGIAIYPDHGETVEGLLRNADVALYDAKQRGKNHASAYRPHMNDKGYERLVLESEMSRGLERNEFYLCYQPRVHLESGQVTSAEALLRWNNSVLGAVSPGEFIPLAEETGFILPIGQWVIEQVCSQLCDWTAAGLQPVRVAINVSARQFQQGLVDVVRDALHRYELKAELLEVEITETTLLQNEAEAIETMNALQSMGIRVSIDDFGRGYSSLGYLQHYPIDTLKIDQSFVRAIRTGKTAIVKAMITLAHSLNLEVVAEGVEEVDERSFLQENGCDEMQGYLFSRPIPGDAFQAFLRSAGPASCPGHGEA